MSDRSPDQIRQEIETARDELADTAAALAYKADVKARANDRKQEVKADLKAKAEELKSKVEGVRASADQATPGGVKSAAASAGTTVQTTVRAKPIESAAAGAAILGFALGYLIARRH